VVASHFSKAGIGELFADGPHLLMAASFSPPHRAEEVAGGYRLTGRGPFASTIHDCPWLLMTGMVFDGDTPRMTASGPEIVALALPTSEIHILETWRSLGMRGTDSNDVSVNAAFVPTSRSFRVTPEFERAKEFRGPLYRLPATVSVNAVVAPVALAVARGAITELREVADRRTPLGSVKTMRHRPAVQSAVAEAEALLRSARLLFFDTLATAWRRALAAEPFTLEHKADLLLASTHAVRTASHVADLMHRMGGSTGVYTRSPLERHFRDAQTIRHHGFLCESRLETVGQVYLGVGPDFPMVAF
jgi:indole-3-acetate monooxygenase